MKKKQRHKTHWTLPLVKRRACHEAVRWARRYSTPQRAWNACTNREWMFWLLMRFQPGFDWEQRYNLVDCANRMERPAANNIDIENDYYDRYMCKVIRAVFPKVPTLESK